MQKISMIVLGLFALLATFLFVKIAKSPDADLAKAYFFDVGQGDAILFQNDRDQLLVDGGPDGTILERLGEVMPIDDRTIEKVVLTHPHADHLVGLLQVIDRYQIGEIYGTGVVSDSDYYLEFLSKVKDKKIPYIVPDIGLTEGLFDTAKITFLWPGQNFVKKTASNLNNTSLVSKVCVIDECVFLTGDAEEDERRDLLDNYKMERKSLIKADILKVSHHGSRNGTDENFIQLVDPKQAIISAGADNQFGHPHTETLDILKKINVEIKRTDLEGTIEIVFGEVEK